MARSPRRAAAAGSGCIRRMIVPVSLRCERCRLQPLVEVAQRPHAIACLRSLPLKLPAMGGNRPKLMFIGWKVVASAPPVMWPRRAPIAGWWAAARPGAGRGARPREPAGHQADGGALDITLAAGDLAGEAQSRHGLQAQRAVQQARAVEEGVAVQASQPRELGVLQAGDGSEDARLLAVLQLGLGSPRCSTACPAHCPGGSCTTAQGRWPVRGFAQAPRLHRSEAQALRSGRGDDLDRLAALEVGRVVLPLLELGLSPASSAATKASYCGLSIGQLK